MILQVMALYDCKARVHRVPFFVAHVDVGIRAVEGAVNEVGHELARYAQDFSLWHLGEFDDVTATFFMKAQGVNLGSLLSLKKPAGNTGPMELLSKSKECA